MKSSNLLRVAFTALAVAVAACSSTPAKDKSAQDKPLAPANPFRADSAEQLAAKERKLGAEGLYRQARLALDSGDFSTAISRYGQIAARFPFTEYATQADLERVYALYRSFQPDDALTAADKFLKEHPRHPNADYIQYIKGLVNTSRDEGLSGAFGLDNTKEDVSYLRRAFDDFSLLAQKYPTSLYAGDARQHMIDLRNRIAQHDMHVVHYYIKRGAFIAAAKRAEQILLQYPGAPATVEAMQVLEKCYTQMGLTDQAAEVHKLLVAQLAVPAQGTDYPVAPKKPGFFSGLLGSSKSKPTLAPPPAVKVIPVADVATPAAPDTTPAPEAAKPSGNWLKQLFTPGNEPIEGATIVLPSKGSKPASSPDAAPGTTTATPTPSGDGAIHGNGFSITMEPYDDVEPKKATAAPASSAAASTPAAAPTPAAPATKETSEEPTFSNWFHGLFSSSKKPAENAPAAAAPASTPAAAPAPDGKSAADASEPAKPADENKAPTLYELLYHSVVPDKKADDSTTTTDGKDSTPAATP